MNPPDVGPLLAFGAGILSFLSPCVLPLVPSYVGFLTGMTVDELADRRRWALLHALLFVTGFSLIFIALGATATALGAALAYHRDVIARVGGALIIAFGLHTLGIFRVGLLDREMRLHLDRKPLGFLGSFIAGLVFAAGWTPCLGPVLGTILGLAGLDATMTRGVALLAAYSAGLAVPFLLAAYALDAFRGWFQRFRQWLPWVQRISGAILVAVGLLLVTGEFTRLAGLLTRVTPEWLLRRV